MDKHIADFDSGEAYLDLLKKALTRTGFDDCFGTVPRNTRTLFRAMRWRTFRAATMLLGLANLEIVSRVGRVGESMMGLGAMNNLHSCIKQVFDDNVPGDLCETGIWRGGGCIFMAAAAKVYRQGDRKIWCCDSFEGLPKPNSELYPADAGDELWKQELGVSVEEVKANFEKYNLLDENVRFLKGFFSDTMPTAPIERLAVLRLDGDMYESTIVVLDNLYEKIYPGGFVIFDDYGMIEGCDKAVHDFRNRMRIEEPLEIIGYVNGKPLGAFWRKRG
jgi:hypothetical protein